MVNKSDILMEVYAVTITDINTYETNTKLFVSEAKAKAKAKDEYAKIVGNILINYLNEYMGKKNTPYIDDECAMLFFEESAYECENICRLTIQNKIVEMTKLFVE